MKSFSRKTTAPSDVNITPLLDIVFQLLLFFILTSALVQPAIDLDLPESSRSSDYLEADLVISADKEGRIYFNDRNIALSEVEPALRAFAARNSGGEVIFRADGVLPYKDFFAILEASGAAGIENFHLAYEEK
ncbi:MAG: biopolymer transporter ExbD [Spirochaetaceae bacterium]|jgi:biopolymer transport protein ExbD|nr:biopolymer transporter ExbD [Spirochaetaceae bacterium]